MAKSDSSIPPEYNINSLATTMDMQGKDVLLIQNVEQFNKYTEELKAGVLVLTSQVASPELVRDDFNCAVFEYLDGNDHLPTISSPKYLPSFDYILYAKHQETIQQVFISVDLTKLTDQQVVAVLSLIYDMCSEDEGGIGKKLKFIMHDERIPTKILSITTTFDDTEE
ncbi:hypothetical protein HYV12_01130 [Candidatus Dojkabacteria bacterium]|nr:hypothetical protein [Candidatus Dojkabacteria bacterium]